jgi:hypothetical protein
MNYHEPIAAPIPTNAYTMMAYLQDNSVRHLLTEEDPFRGTDLSDKGITTSGDIFLLSRYHEIEFHGIMPDTGAARISTGGQLQFRALQRICSPLKEPGLSGMHSF